MTSHAGGRVIGSLGPFVVALLCVIAPSVFAEPGSLDPSFDGDGMVLTAFSPETDDLRALALQPDGKILAAGYAQFEGIALARYHPDGSLDTSFGDGGRVITDLSSFGASAVGVQSSGRIVVAAQRADFTVLGYTPAGELDPTFGTAGVASIDIGDDAVYALAIQPDDKIVLAGAVTGGETNLDFGLARFDADGSPDATFGDGGRVTTNFAMQDGFPSSEIAYAVALQDDGKIVATGGMSTAFTEEGEEYPTLITDFVVARYLPDGSLDPGFGDGGAVTTDVNGGVDVARAIALHADGRIVAVGGADRGGTDTFGLVRYLGDGSLDATFGGDGVVATDLPGFSERADAAVIQASGKIVAAGHGSQDFTVARYEVDGALDLTFGDGGVVRVDFAGSTDDANAMVVQPDERLIVGGSARVASNDDDFALARLNGLGITTSVPAAATVLRRLSVFPNPSSEGITFSLSGTSGGEAMPASVVDVSGRVVRQWVISGATPEGGAVGWTWDGRDDRGQAVAPGLYVARVQIDGTLISRKVLLSR